MELWAWFLMIAVCAFGFATCALIAANIYGARRIKRLENLVVWQDERLYDLTQACEVPVRVRYEQRRRERRTPVEDH